MKKGQSLKKGRSDDDHHHDNNNNFIWKNL